jgi:NAD(P)-dependent dehydrogenase (short-subunit alcohol dehydrogenase family)
MEPPLEEKCIVIIGGTSGIGFSAAKACMANGARVVCVGVDEASVETAREELGQGSLIMHEDATIPETAQNAINLCLDTYGEFDGLFHVAGGSGRSRGDAPLHKLSDDGWQYTMNLNLNSVMFSNRAAVQTFRKRKTSGSIVNVTSTLAYSPSPHFFSTHAYATAKAAIIGLTKSVASCYAPENIRANAIAPGLIATPMSERAQESKEIIDFITKKQPLDGGRIGHSGDLDGAVLYLLSNQSLWVTGQVLEVSGGWSISEGYPGG